MKTLLSSLILFVITAVLGSSETISSGVGLIIICTASSAVLLLILTYRKVRMDTVVDIHYTHCPNLRDRVEIYNNRKYR